MLMGTAHLQKTCHGSSTLTDAMSDLGHQQAGRTPTCRRASVQCFRTPMPTLNLTQHTFNHQWTQPEPGPLLQARLGQDLGHHRASSHPQDHLDGNLRKELAKESATGKSGKRTSKANVKAGYSKARPLRATAKCMFPLPLSRKNSLHRFSEDEDTSSLPLSLSATPSSQFSQSFARSLSPSPSRSPRRVIRHPSPSPQTTALRDLIDTQVKNACMVTRCTTDPYMELSPNFSCST